MNIKSIYIIIVCCFSFICAKDIDENVKWSKHSKLTWNDYKGKPDFESGFSAISAISTKYEADINKNVLKIRIEVSLNTDRSWVREEQKDNRVILDHEQGHFDLTEVCARKFRYKVLNAHLTKTNYQTLIQSLYADYKNENDAQNDKYDIETNYSMDTEAQKMWLERINSQLNASKSCSKTIISIKLK